MSIHSLNHQCNGSSVDPGKLRIKRRMRLELELSGRQHKAISIGMGVDQAILSRWLNDQYPDVMPSHRLPDWEREVGPGLWEWLEQERPAAPSQQHPDIAGLTILLAKVGGQCVSELIQALADHEWSEDERRANLPALRKLQSVVNALVHEAEVQA